MWTAENRARYDRSRLRYPSDLTDDEWAHVSPLIPPAKRGGNRRHVDVREVMNGIMFVLSTKAATRWLSIDGVVGPKIPMIGSLAGCCARAASDHGATPPPSATMSSRRPM